jgi:microcystin-dependent protein
LTIDAYPGKSYDNFMVVTSITRPVLPWPGLMVFESDTSSIRFWNGSAWIGIPPSGTLHDYAGGDITPGYLLADGTLKNRSQYFDLFAVCGFQYSPTPGQDPGNNEFYLPNVKGRVSVGQDTAQTEFDVRGEKAGSKTHTLVVSEMPVHTHIQDPHNHDFSTAATAMSNPQNSLIMGAGNPPTAVGGTIGTRTATNQSAGSGGAHNNLQPYIVLPRLIKI